MTASFTYNINNIKYVRRTVYNGRKQTVPESRYLCIGFALAVITFRRRRRFPTLSLKVRDRGTTHQFSPPLSVSCCCRALRYRLASPVFLYCFPVAFLCILHHLTTFKNVCAEVLCSDHVPQVLQASFPLPYSGHQFSVCANIVVTFTATCVALPLTVLATRVGRTMNDLSPLMSVFHVLYQFCQ